MKPTQKGPICLTAVADLSKISGKARDSSVQHHLVGDFRGSQFLRTGDMSPHNEAGNTLWQFVSSGGQAGKGSKVGGSLWWFAIFLANGMPRTL
jgi:hypothetical protein